MTAPKNSSKVSALTLLNREVELDFVLPGLVKGTVGALIAPGGVGKSFWALELGMEISQLQTPGVLSGLSLSKGKVVYLAAEDPLDILATRMQAIAPISPTDVLADLTEESNLEIHCYRQSNVEQPDIMSAPYFISLIESCAGARLIIVDTLRRFHNLDENSTSDMTQVISRFEQLAEKTQAAVLLLHHTSKSSALNGATSLQQAARGASVITDNARWLAFLEPMNSVQAKTFGIMPNRVSRYVRWNISKQNYVAAHPDIWYRRNDQGVLIRVQLSAEAAKASGNVAHEGDQSIYGGDGSEHANTLWKDAPLTIQQTRETFESMSLDVAPGSSAANSPLSFENLLSAATQPMPQQRQADEASSLELIPGSVGLAVVTDENGLTPNMPSSQAPADALWLADPANLAQLDDPFFDARAAQATRVIGGPAPARQPAPQNPTPAPAAKQPDASGSAQAGPKSPAQRSAEYRARQREKLALLQAGVK